MTGLPRTLLVLGGGGAMGAYQAGALLGLVEGGLVPDALFGCSAGALNAAFLAGSPTVARAGELAEWWLDGRSQQLLSPSWRSHVRGVPELLRRRGAGLLDTRALRALIRDNVPAHDLSELAVPVSVTTTCLDCAAARHHSSGPVVDVLVASCALPGLFAPVRLPDGHLHVDGGVLDGVPLDAALASAGPDDRVVVVDCGLAPVTGGNGCANGSGLACGLEPVGRGPYVAPRDGGLGAFETVLRSFTVARTVANRAAVEAGLSDPRVIVVPHLADAWAAGWLDAVPRGPRDFTQAPGLVRAGQRAAGHVIAQAGRAAPRS
jgi:predicted acylesterase/phospholipase RssA